MRHLASALLVTVLAVVACKRAPTLGGACDTQSPIACADVQTALACKDGRFSAVPCKGRGGCKGFAGGAECDTAVAAVGDPCIEKKTDATVACSSDKKSALTCRRGAFALLMPCRGPKHCAVKDGALECDASIGEPEDACAAGDGKGACSADGKSLLSCADGRLRLAKPCRGAKGCVVDPASAKPACDDSVAALGDPCEPSDKTRCSVDAKLELACSKGTWTKKRACYCKGSGCVQVASDCD